MNKLFVNVTKRLKVRAIETERKELTLSEILCSYKDHQNFAKVRPRINDENSLFSFKSITSDGVLN